MPVAVIFDMDGLLIDSEPLWQAAEIAELARCGLSLTRAECEKTTGLRIDEVVHHYAVTRGLGGAAPAEVVRRIVDDVIVRVRAHGVAKPGVAAALAAARALGPVGLASSSPRRLIDAILAHLGLGFDAVASAEAEPYGKPHPAVYLAAARALGVPPIACVAVEDSISGMIAAKAARMRCVMVPDGAAVGDRRLALADAVLPTLEGFPAYAADLARDEPARRGV